MANSGSGVICAAALRSARPAVSRSAAASMASSGSPGSPGSNFVSSRDTFVPPSYFFQGAIGDHFDRGFALAHNLGDFRVAQLAHEAQGYHLLLVAAHARDDLEHLP